MELIDITNQFLVINRMIIDARQGRNIEIFDNSQFKNTVKFTLHKEPPQNIWNHCLHDTTDMIEKYQHVIICGEHSYTPGHIELLNLSEDNEFYKFLIENNMDIKYITWDDILSNTIYHRINSAYSKSYGMQKFNQILNLYGIEATYSCLDLDAGQRTERSLRSKKIKIKRFLSAIKSFFI